MEKESLIRKVLSNEIAQIAGICVALWFFVNTVILPINNIQSSLVNIQLSLKEMKDVSADFDTRITANSDDIIRIKERLIRYNIK